MTASVFLKKVVHTSRKKIFFKPFQVNVPFLYPLKMSEDQRYRNGGSIEMEY